MKTILVATDFSPAALNASNYAADMAMAIGADVLLLHMYSLPVSYSEIPVTVSIQAIQQNAEQMVNELKNGLVKRTGGNVNIKCQARVGAFFHELKVVCEKIKPYTVVMGSQGTTAVERLLFGSHAVYAMKHLEWPLITVPPEAKFSAVKKIGLACDFDHVVDSVPVDEIKMLVDDFHAELHILNIGKKHEFKPELVFESGLLQEMLMAVEPRYHFITNDNTDEGILNFAEKMSIDLLIVLPKRHGLADKLVHASHTKRFVLHSHVPVMAIH